MGKLLDLLEGRRTNLVTERDGILDNATPETFTPEIEARAAALDSDIAEIDGRIAEQREREAAEQRAGQITASTVVTREPNPVYRKGDASASFFRDLTTTMCNRSDLGAGSINDARVRLEQSQERALTTVAGAGGQFAPPLWLVEDFVALARPARVAADLMNKQALPEGVSSVNLPTVATGTTVAVQATQNTAVSNTDLTTSSVTSGITTIAGQQVVSLQLLKQSGIPFDQVILSDLARAYATQLDLQVLTGSGSSGQLRGLLNGSGVGSTTFTSASPAVTSATAANSFYNKLISAITAVHTNRYLPPTAIIMHPVRWGWVLEALDSQTRPLVTPHAYPVLNSIGDSAATPQSQGLAGELLGLPVYIDPNIPQNLGAGTNEDRVFVVRQDDLWLYESPVEAASFDATYANQASILFRVLGYSAFIPDRYGKSVNVISGTGLVTPTL